MFIVPYKKQNANVRFTMFKFKRKQDLQASKFRQKSILGTENSMF